MYKVEQVANYFIERGLMENNPVNPMKLQKMLYFAYGWNYAFFNEKLFDEPIQAWKYGPVVEKIYHDVKQYGNYPITSLISKYLIGDGDDMFSFKTSTPKIDISKATDQTNLLDAMWKVYSQFSAVYLSDLTHAIGTPWYKIQEKFDLSVSKGIVIDDQEIKEYFLGEKEKMEAVNHDN